MKKNNAKAFTVTIAVLLAVLFPLCSAFAGEECSDPQTRHTTCMGSLYLEGFDIRASDSPTMEVTVYGFAHGPPASNLVVSETFTITDSFQEYRRDSYFTNFNDLACIILVSSPSNPTDRFCLRETLFYDPTAITLASFTAHPGNGSIRLTWVTGDETDNLGFNIYRAEMPDGEYRKINDTLIYSKVGTGLGTSYTLVDNDVTNTRTYRYKLEDVDIFGVRTQHEPVQATPRLIYGIFATLQALYAQENSSIDLPVFIDY